MNLHIYPSSFRHESRILRITKSLARSAVFSKIYVASVWEEGLEEQESLDAARHIWRAKLWIRRQRGGITKALRHLEWTIRVALRFLMEDIQVVNCHTLTVLPLGVFFKLYKHCKLIYDPHELETETAGLNRTRQRASRLLERFLIPFADATIVVNESIASWYRARYHLKKVFVIRNFPEICPAPHGLPSIRERLGLGENDLLFLYLGLFDVGRGIDILLEVFSHFEERHILFLGYGPLKQAIEDGTKKSKNIHILPAVSPAEVLGCARQADVGLALIEDVCLSYHYALPNKIFEYISAGIPIIVSDLPEMAKVIDDHRCGWKIRCDESELDSLIRSLSAEDIKEKTSNALACRERFDWAHEEKVLLRLYAGMVPSARMSAHG